jgi:hypothetical protein
VTQRWAQPAWFVVPLAAAAVAAIAVVGADSRWLAAVGAIVASGHLPDSLPFATAPTDNWQNVPVLGELIFHWLHTLFGERGLVLAQVVAALIGFGALMAGLRRQGTSAATATAVGLLVLAGALPLVGVVRNELFSLACFPLLLLILEGETRRPSRRLWLVVPLVALWTNLHGTVLVGLSLLAAYILTARRRAFPVLVAALLAACATPVLWRTPEYYWSVAHNEAARLGVGLWAPLGTGRFDVLLVLCACALVLAATTGRAWAPWELIGVVLLVVGAVGAARFGIWLLFVAAYPAARGRVQLRRPATVHVAVLAGLAALALAALMRPTYDPGSRRLAAQAARMHQPVLADALLAEQVELAGGKVWVADPIDAFRHADQRLYLSWLAGERGGTAAVGHARLVFVQSTSPAGRAAAGDARLTRVARDRSFVLYRVG